MKLLWLRALETGGSQQQARSCADDELSMSVLKEGYE